VQEHDGTTVISTQECEVSFLPDDPVPLDTLSVRLKNNGAEWRYGDRLPATLGGTVRTLDGHNGPVTLEPGLISRAGWYVVDDSKTPILNESGVVLPRERGMETTDLYFFGYGRDYAGCIRDLYAVCGDVALVPRWVLGNWYSRYHPYHAHELLEVMERFEEHEIPLSVCVIDMDWHVVKNPWHRGWAGYTWNGEYFPDPQGFCAKMHERFGVAIGLNLHPDSGVAPHEEAYPQMARHMKKDLDKKEVIPFSPTDPRFIDGYLRLLHHPHEQKGVDFWWIDWQQGKTTDIEGCDPLWLLNHYHFLDSGREGRRPFIFSRWSGLGGHRYPIGFSGDTVVSWESLAFQPYFTATAANVGYGWWSHDIGGHFYGDEDPQLYARWVQFGALSPILRLHSSKNTFVTRYPWDQGFEAYHCAKEAMRLRRRLLPYLYSMNRRASQKGVPLVRPMYWRYPEREESYHCPQQYLFGSELMAAPFTTPVDSDTRASRQVIWLPEGLWYDFFDGTCYEGNRFQPFYGELDAMPLFAPAGAIVPLDVEKGQISVPHSQTMEARIFAGADNRFDLYEDDGISTRYIRGEHFTTTLTQRFEERTLHIAIEGQQARRDFMPQKRRWILTVCGVIHECDVNISAGGTSCDGETSYDARSHRLTISLPPVSPTQPLSVEIMTQQASLLARDNHFNRRMYETVKRFRLPGRASLKNRIYQAFVCGDTPRQYLFPILQQMSLSQQQCVCEHLFDAGMHLLDMCGEKQKRLVFWNNSHDETVTWRLDTVKETGNVPDSVPHFAAVFCGTDADSSTAEGCVFTVSPDKGWSAHLNYENVALLIKRKTKE